MFKRWFLLPLTAKYSVKKAHLFQLYSPFAIYIDETLFSFFSLSKNKKLELGRYVRGSFFLFFSFWVWEWRWYKESVCVCGKVYGPITISVLRLKMTNHESPILKKKKRNWKLLVLYKDQKPKLCYKWLMSKN